MKNLISMLAIAALSACIWEGYYKSLTNDYALQGLESKSNVDLVYKDGKYNLGVVTGPLRAYSIHADYIAVIKADKKYAKQLSDIKLHGEYYLIPLNNPISSDFQKNVMGPFDEAAFNRILLSMRYDLPGDFSLIN